MMDKRIGRQRKMPSPAMMSANNSTARVGGKISQSLNQIISGWAEMAHR